MNARFQADPMLTGFRLASAVGTTVRCHSVVDRRAGSMADFLDAGESDGAS